VQRRVRTGRPGDQARDGRPGRGAVAVPQAGGAAVRGSGRRYALSYPADWFVATDPGIAPCTFFDDRPVSVASRSEALGVAIRVDVRDVPLLQARQDALSEGDTTAEDRSVGDRRAVRLSGVLTGEVLLPAGTRITTWLVEDGGRTIVLTADDAGTDDYDAAVEVLDAMVQTLEVL
jgi:hypothetical protein